MEEAIRPKLYGTSSLKTEDEKFFGDFRLFLTCLNSIPPLFEASFWLRFLAFFDFLSQSLKIGLYFSLFSSLI